MYKKERVEIACHTGFCQMYGTGLPDDKINLAIEKKMVSMAVTDTGCMGSFPEFDSYLTKKEFENFKMIYGCEFLAEGDNNSIVKISTLIRNNTGRENLYRFFSKAEKLYRNEKGTPITIPISEFENGIEGVIVGIYADDMDNFNGYDYVMVTSDMESDFVKGVINYCENTGIIPAAVSPFCIFSTEEMLKQFDYLDESQAMRIVVNNTNLIADMCDFIHPMDKVKYVPTYLNGKEKLSKLCYSALGTKYKDVTPELKERLNWELNAISEGGHEYIFLNIYDVMKSININTFEIGSRGNAGGCLVAFLLGITNVDPIKFNLPPYFFFAFDGYRHPDIDINLRNEEQWEEVVSEYSKLQNIETIIRAGIYVTPNDTELMDTKFSINKHPGGILIIPKGIEADKVIPLRNLGDKDNPEMVSEFFYYYIDGIFTKTDFLLNSAPKMIYEMWKETGVDPSQISLDDSEVMKMFIPDKNGNLGCAGLPEFDTEISLDFLRLAKPQNIEELATLLGYLHGTGTLDQVEALIISGTATVSEIPGCREDIFNYLVKKGFDEKEAYNIAEMVRKGRVKNGLASTNNKRWAISTKEKWSEFKNKCGKAGIPDWYVKYLENIGYMFPKAHTLAYIIETWRLAWYKMNFPQSDLFRL